MISNEQKLEKRVDQYLPCQQSHRYAQTANTLAVIQQIQ